MQITELKVENPYVGPRPFEERHQRRFFGRDWEANELVSLVVAHPAVLLYAQSGAGKTSLINAKLVPLLRDGEGLQVMPVAQVRGEVPQEVQPEQIENLFVFSTLLGWIESGADPAQLVGLSLSAFLAGWPRPKDEEGQPTLRVVIFDQFEELFTLYPERWTEREGFFAQVADALSEDPFLRVLFVLREDYLAQLDPYVALLPERLRTRFRLERLRQEAALAAVKGPLMDTKRSFAPGVAEGLVEELLKIRVETRVGETVEVPGEFVEPVQLQVVCWSLWDELPPDITEITQSHLRAFGDVDQALLAFYERALRSAIQQAKVREGKLRAWFERDLITPMGTRGTAYRGAKSTGGVPNVAIDALEGQHLIRAERRAGARWYELTHDRFIGPIQRSNETWRAARRERWLRIGGGVAVVLVLLFVGITVLQTLVTSRFISELLREVVQTWGDVKETIAAQETVAVQAEATIAAQETAVAQVEATATAALDPAAQATASFRDLQTKQAEATAASIRLGAVTPQPGETEMPSLDPTAIAAFETATAAAQSLQIAGQKATAVAAESEATATAALAASATAAAQELREQLQTAGLPPIEDVTARLSRHPTERFERRTLNQIQYLIIQHSATQGDLPPERIAKYLVEQGQWPGIGYHFYITSDGTIYRTNDLETICCFAGSNAQYSSLGVCICFAGNFTDEVPTAAQLSSGGELLAFLMQELHLSMESIIGAKEVKIDTQSPGQQWDSGRKWKDMLLVEVKAAQGAGLANIEAALARVRDRDGDGIPDVEDACPDEPGSSLAGGCPETPTVTPTLPPTPTATPTSTPSPTWTPTVSIPITRTIEITGGVKVQMVYVPAGEFLRGTSDEEVEEYVRGYGWDREWFSDEKPQKLITLDAFWIDMTEVTNEQFEQFVQDTGHETGPGKIWNADLKDFVELGDVDWRHPQGPGDDLSGKADHPVVQVSWDDAEAYCRWRGARLPTEAEWEKAAGWDYEQNRKRIWPWGDKHPTPTDPPAKQKLNCCDAECEANWKDSKINDGFKATAPVGSYPQGASPYGVLDMSGNVWEWVADYYDEGYYEVSPVKNPLGPDVDTGRRVLRGTSWIQGYREEGRAASRFFAAPDTRNFDIGFRCAQSP